jgi:hypothetical protein
MSGTHERFTPLATSAEIGSNRSFGLIFTAFLLLVGLMPLVHGQPMRIWALAAACVFFIVALFVPRVLARPNYLWMQLGLLLSRIVSPIALGILFFGVVTPIGLCMRILSKDPLRLKFDSSAKSYWIERTPPGPSAESLNHPF